MAFSQADLDTIRTHIASGVTRVRYADGSEVSYQTVEAMMKAEQRIMGALASAQPGGRPRRWTPAWRNGC